MEMSLLLGPIGLLFLYRTRMAWFSSTDQIDLSACCCRSFKRCFLAQTAWPAIGKEKEIDIKTDGHSIAGTVASIRLGSEPLIFFCSNRRATFLLFVGTTLGRGAKRRTLLGAGTAVVKTQAAFTSASSGGDRLLRCPADGYATIAVVDRHESWKGMKGEPRKAL